MQNPGIAEGVDCLPRAEPERCRAAPPPGIASRSWWGSGASSGNSAPLGIRTKNVFSNLQLTTVFTYQRYADHSGEHGEDRSTGKLHGGR